MGNSTEEKSKETSWQETERLLQQISNKIIKLTKELEKKPK